VSAASSASVGHGGLSDLRKATLPGKTTGFASAIMVLIRAAESLVSSGIQAAPVFSVASNATIKSSEGSSAMATNRPAPAPGLMSS
jgi:hypothetical protein